jgi:hypothetical protein
MVSDLEVFEECVEECGRIGDDAGVFGDAKDDETSRVSHARLPE